jgi:hypothetical protein
MASPLSIKSLKNKLVRTRKKMLGIKGGRCMRSKWGINSRDGKHIITGMVMLLKALEM